MFSEKLQQKDGAQVEVLCAFCDQPNPSKFHTCEGLKQARMEFERQQRSEQLTATEEINNAT